MKNPLDTILYKLDDGSEIGVILKDEDIWITQKALSALFGVSTQTISRHINNVYSDGELSRLSTCTKIVQVQNEGGRRVSREVEVFNLDVIISVGYRVNSQKATNFRIWATKVLREYTLKGFALDDDRLKKGAELFDKDYFDELLERVRSIRASERRIWQKITDIYAECSIDYDKDSKTTRDFYAMVQNKFHYAITGLTAPEIIYGTANHEETNMGLKTWKQAIGETLMLRDGRRAYGQRMLDRGVPIEYVSHCMGHDSVETTQKFYADYRDKMVLGEVRNILNNNQKRAPIEKR